MKTKLFGILLIFGSLTLIINEYIDNKNDVTFHNKKINEMFINNGNKIDDEYIGYIEIERLGIKRLIKEGITSEVLDNNFVGYVTRSKPINEIGNTVLAGHSINIVFAKLHSLKIEDTIIITTYDKSYKYKVSKKYETSPDDVSIYNSGAVKELTLITCTNNNSKRLIIKAEYVL